MGAKNLLLITVAGKVHVAQYCPWDGYPTGQGAVISKFLREANLDKFKSQVESLKFVTPLEVNKLWKQCGTENETACNIESDDLFLQRHPEFHQDTGAEILNLIYQEKAHCLFNNATFISSILCEYVYEINLDFNTVILTIDGHLYNIYSIENFSKKGTVCGIEYELKRSSKAMGKRLTRKFKQLECV